MRSGISITVSSADRKRLEAIVSDPKSAQKHVWRAMIVLLTDEGLGTAAIMARSGKSKTCVWRWQERFMQEGVDGLLHDASRRARSIMRVYRFDGLSPSLQLDSDFSHGAPSLQPRQEDLGGRTLRAAGRLVLTDFGSALSFPPCR